MRIVNKQLFEFDSRITGGPLLKYHYTDNDIKNEPMLFNCDKKYAFQNGGPITTDFLERLNLSGGWCDQDIIIDSRVHMLMPGWYPCISGWHHDDVPRTRSDGQPDYVSPAYKAEHCCCVVNSKIAPTEFALGSALFPDIEPGEKYYKKWHPLVEKNLYDGIFERIPIQDSQLIFFDWETWHQGVPAVGNGWRFFIRATKNTGRKPTNEIRRQVQIYLPNPIEGW